MASCSADFRRTAPWWRCSSSPTIPGSWGASSTPSSGRVPSAPIPCSGSSSARHWPTRRAPVKKGDCRGDAVEIANGKWQVTAPAPTQANRPLDDGRCSILPGILDREWVSLALRILWSVLVFYPGLDIVLRSDEGLYAAVARRIVQTNEWLPLVYQGQPYLNKPPLYFWLMALPFTLWGPTEFAARFPSATFGVATVGLVYWCGRRLFDRWVGWVAALIATTTFSTVWHAHEARFDIPLAFWINLAVIALYLAHPREG